MAKSETSVAEQIRQLLEQANALKEQRKVELLEIINAQIEELHSLGFTDYVFSDRPSHAGQAATKRTGRPAGTKNAPRAAADPSGKYNAERYCKVCGINGHDTKAHNFHKEKFTTAELTSKGWLPPEQATTA